MSVIGDDMKAIQRITFEAYKACGSLLALIDGNADPTAIADTLDKVVAQFESGVVTLRNTCEKHRVYNHICGKKPESPHISYSGKAEVNEYGWLHIELSALLPNCRFGVPSYLTDTIARLLDAYEKRGPPLPRFDKAMLVIDEHCDIDSRMVYDQDNKSWKAIPNVLKGRLIKDDDQFSLSVALISTRNRETACHIYLLPQDDASDFFYLRGGNYAIFP